MTEEPRMPKSMSTFEKTWRKELWTNDDFYSQVIRFRVKVSDAGAYSGSGEKEVVYCCEDVKLDGKQARSEIRSKILQSYRNLKEIFLAGNHSCSDYDPQSNRHPSDKYFQATREWYIRWALSQKGDPWEKDFGSNYAIAKEKGWIGELKDEQPQKSDEITVSLKKHENQLRLIGVLVDILQDENVTKKNTKNAQSIAKHIADTYGVDLPNKGLAERTVTMVLTEAKKRLKQDGIK